MLTGEALDVVVGRIAANPAMAVLEKGVIAYLQELRESLFEDGDVSETESGVVFCGCDDCEAREILTYVVPRIVALAANAVVAELAERNAVDRCQDCGSAFDEHQCGEPIRVEVETIDLGPQQ